MVATGVPGAGWSYRSGGVAFGRVERLTSRVWLVVEDDRFGEHPFLYVVVGSERVVLVDTGAGTAPYGDWLDGFVGGAAGPAAAALPRTIVNTHCHYDHVGGNASCEGAVVCASSRDRAFTGAAFDRDRDASLAFEVGAREPLPYVVDRWLDDGERVELGGGDALVAHHAPGHTPDSLCFYYARDAILFVGDVVYPRAPVVLACRDSSVVQFLASLVKLERILAEAPAATLACGHNAASFPAAKVADLRRLVDDALVGALAPTPDADLLRTADALYFKRGDLSVTVRRDALGRFEAKVPEAFPASSPR